MKIGLVSFAHVHAESYASVLQRLEPETARWVGVYDEVAARGRARAAQYGVPCYDSLEALLERVDAIIICSVNADHHRYTLAAAQAGRHVLCEKPLATRLQDGEAMVAACRRAGVQLMTAFPMRFSPPVVAAVQAVRDGRVGRVRAVTGSNNGQMPAGWFSDPALAGGGALADHVVHLTDIMRWIVGSEPVEVYAEADTLLHAGIQVEDVGFVHLRFADGTAGAIDASWSRPASFPTWGGLRFRVVGTDGAIEVDAFSQNAMVYSDRAPRPWWAYWGSDADEAMIRAFIRAVGRGEPVPVRGEDGLAALRVASAARESARAHRPVPCPAP